MNGDENPWVKVLGAVGVVLAIVGVVLAVIPAGENLDVVRTFLGAGLVTAGVLGLLLAFLLAGLGWYLRRRK